MHKSAQKAAKRTNTKVASTKAQPKRQVKKVQKKKATTTAKRSNATSAAADLDTTPIRKTPPDYYKNRKRVVEEDTTYHSILNGPTQVYTSADLPDTPSQYLLNLHPRDFVNPVVWDQIRYGTGKTENEYCFHKSLFLPKGMYDEFKLMSDYKDPSFLKKISLIKTKVAAQPFAQEGDEYWVSDPFGIHALTTLRLAQRDQFSAEVNPHHKVGFAEAAGSALGISYLGIYLFDALTGSKLALPGIQSIVPADFQHLLTSPESNFTSRFANAIPLAAVGTALGYGSSRILSEGIETNTFLPDLSVGGPELRLAVKHLQRIVDAYEAGTYREQAVAAFDRHSEKVANVIPNGDLIDTKLNFDFFMPPRGKKAADHHH